jgi:hypothetical protein
LPENQICPLATGTFFPGPTVLRLLTDDTFGPSLRSRSFEILDVAQAAPPGAKAPAALPEAQTQILAANTEFFT